MAGIRELEELDKALARVLAGADEELPSGLQASLQRAVYLLANGVLAMGSNAAMKQALDALPDSVRPLVAAECRRLTDWRNNNAN